MLYSDMFINYDCACVERLANPHLVAADDINFVDDVEALNVLEDTLKPPKYDPLNFWNHIQSRVNNLPNDLAVIYSEILTIL